MWILCLKKYETVILSSTKRPFFLFSIYILVLHDAKKTQLVLLTTPFLILTSTTYIYCFYVYDYECLYAGIKCNHQQNSSLWLPTDADELQWRDPSTRQRHPTNRSRQAPWNDRHPCFTCPDQRLFWFGDGYRSHTVLLVSVMHRYCNSSDSTNPSNLQCRNSFNKCPGRFLKIFDLERVTKHQQNRHFHHAH